MGTRNLTAVYMGGKHVVAQYGQWDGYPSGQGLVALAFLRQIAGSPIVSGKSAVRKEWVANLEKCRWLTDEERKAAPNMPDNEFREKYPAINRDHGAKILQMILKKPQILNDELDFAADSLFCEYAYVVDLDNDKFEVYKGFNKDKPVGRFADLPKEDDSEYEPVTLLAGFDLNDLPDDREFLLKCGVSDD